MIIEDIHAKCSRRRSRYSSSSGSSSGSSSRSRSRSRRRRSRSRSRSRNRGGKKTNGYVISMLSNEIVAIYSSMGKHITAAFAPKETTSCAPMKFQTFVANLYNIHMFVKRIHIITSRLCKP